MTEWTVARVFAAADEVATSMERQDRLVRELLLLMLVLPRPETWEWMKLDPCCLVVAMENQPIRRLSLDSTASNADGSRHR